MQWWPPHWKQPFQNRWKYWYMKCISGQTEQNIKNENVQYKTLSTDSVKVKTIVISTLRSEWRENLNPCKADNEQQWYKSNWRQTWITRLPLHLQSSCQFFIQKIYKIETQFIFQSMDRLVLGSTCKVNTMRIIVSKFRLQTWKPSKLITY